MHDMGEETRKLLALFEELNASFFEGRLPPVELRFSRRLQTSGGQYFRGSLCRRTGTSRAPRIQIATRYLGMDDAWNEIRDTLGHEMVHYWLDWQGKPCGHTPEFRRKLGACGFQRYSRLIPPGARHLYQCPSCRQKYFRRRRGVWSCGPCSGRRFNPAYRLELLWSLS